MEANAAPPAAAAAAPGQPPKPRPGRQRTRSVSFARDRSESVSLRDRSRSRGRGREPSYSPDRRHPRSERRKSVQSVEYGYDDYDSAADSPSRSRSKSRDGGSRRSRDMSRSKSRDRGRMSRGVLDNSPPRKGAVYPISRSPSRSKSRPRSRRRSSTERQRGGPYGHHDNKSRASLRQSDKPKALDVVKGAAPLLATIGVASVLAHKFWPKGVLYGDKEDWEEKKPVKHHQSRTIERDRDGRIRQERHVRDDGQKRVEDHYDYRRGESYRGAAGGSDRNRLRPELERRPVSMYEDRRRGSPPQHQHQQPRLEYGRGAVYDSRGLRGGAREYDERPVDRYSTRNWA